jgi:hypothetical protein
MSRKAAMNHSNSCDSKKIFLPPYERALLVGVSITSIAYQQATMEFRMESMSLDEDWIFDLPVGMWWRRGLWWLLAVIPSRTLRERLRRRLTGLCSVSALAVTRAMLEQYRINLKLLEKLSSSGRANGLPANSLPFREAVEMHAHSRSQRALETAVFQGLKR